MRTGESRGILREEGQKASRFVKDLEWGVITDAFENKLYNIAHYIAIGSQIKAKQASKSLISSALAINSTLRGNTFTKDIN
jgi:hypothetical protein